MNLLEELHVKFKHLPKTSPALVMRHTKLHWEACEIISDNLMKIREKEKELATPKRKKWERIK